MKKILAVITVAAITLVAGTAMAKDMNELTVKAEVTGTCMFSSGNSTLDFGTIDPSGTTDATGQAKISYWCTKGVTTSKIVTDDGDHVSGGMKRMQNTATNTEFLPYELALTHPAASFNNGPDTPLELTVDGKITSTNYRTAAAGSYQDIVEISIEP
ncbi:MAG: hypothetical protein EG828_07060 [Deltaproteobacteria bacterium]|nr:hypothetical protein [Deltaproteobacteria bacterium]